MLEIVYITKVHPQSLKGQVEFIAYKPLTKKALLPSRRNGKIKLKVKLNFLGYGLLFTFINLGLECYCVKVSTCKIQNTTQLELVLKIRCTKTNF